MNSYYSILGKNYHIARVLSGKEFLTVRQLKYWQLLGLSNKDAHKQVTRIQSTRVLSKYIEKYGEKEGLIKYQATIDKWMTTMNNKSDEEKLDILIRKTTRSKRYSRKSIDLFEAVFEELKTKNIIFNKTYMGKNEYFIYDVDRKKINFYDLFIKDLKLIVEYHGIMFHPNKQILSEYEWEKWYNIISGNTANKQHQIDLYKHQLVEKNNLYYIEVWENESFDKNKHIIINKILNIYDNKTNNY